jgi:hypothetical protein
MSDDPGTCPYDTCAAKIPSHIFACRRHWFELSPDLRAKIWADFRRGDLEAILENYELADAEWS